MISSPKSILYFVFFFLFNLRLSSQVICSGTVLDSASGLALEFVNLGVPGRGFGTVCDESGRFTLRVPDSLSKEKIRFSLIGYKSVEFPASVLAKTPKVKMAAVSLELKEVTINPKKIKIKSLGNITQSKLVSAGFKGNQLGTEMAIKLNIKHADTYLRKLTFHINSNSLDTFPVFRVNLYMPGPDGMPGENILKKSIIVSPKEKTGLTELDLKPYLLFVSSDVFVSIEWIKDLGDATGLYFSAQLINGATYYRQASQDKWQKTGAVGVGLWVEVGY